MIAEMGRDGAVSMTDDGVGIGLVCVRLAIACTRYCVVSWSPVAAGRTLAKADVQGNNYISPV